MENERPLFAIIGIFLTFLGLYVAFLITIALLNSSKSHAFTQAVEALPFPRKDQEVIIHRNTVYGNYLGQGNGCTTIAYVLYHSPMPRYVMFQTIQSLDFSLITTKIDTPFFWHLFQKEHEEYVEIDAEHITNYGADPDYWRHEALGILVEEEQLMWPDQAFVLMAVTEDQGFWATWDPRCQ